MGDENKVQWGSIASSTAGSAIPAVLGMLFGKSVDKRQMRQQEKLQNLQIAGNKQMIDYSMGKELDMWKATGPTGQVEQMKKAGINPALLYGMGGAGGATTGNPSGSVSGGNAPVGGREVQDAIGMGMQMQLMKSQKANIDADTKNKLAETPNIPLKGENIAASTQSITQGINNQKAEEQLTKAHTRVTRLDAELKGQTLEDMVEMVNYETKRACQEAQQAVNNTNVSDATIQDKIKILKAEAIGGFLRNALTRSETAKTDKTTEAIQLEMTQSFTKIQQEWTHLDNEAKANWIREVAARGGWNDPVDETMKHITNALNGIILLRTGTAQKPTTTPIKGFNR